mgnify:CR=1 FL=1
MSVERPIYENREFYGPLELSKTAPEMRYRYMLEHPDDPTRLIRTTDEGLYINKADMDAQVTIAQYVLEELKEHSVNHVNPTFIDETSDSGEPYMLITVDELTDATAYRELIRNDSLTPDQAQEADHALCGMLEYLKDVVHNDGYYDPEMMNLDQFAYCPSLPNGQKMVLVDVEPIGGKVFNPDEDSIEFGCASDFAATVATLITDAITLSNKSKRPIKSLRKAAEIVLLLPGESEMTEKLKSDLLQAIDSCELTPELEYYAKGVLVDTEDF